MFGFLLLQKISKVLKVALWSRNSSLTCCIVLCSGNDNIHLLTSGRRQELRIDMEDWEGNKVYALYDNFTVGSEQEKYKLISMGQYNGTASQYENV